MCEVKKTKKKELPAFKPKKDVEEPPDQDELQALDEANEPWAGAWRESVRKTQAAHKQL